MEELPENDNKQEDCLNCSAHLKGRFGKKFCSDQCRAQYHNLKKTKDEKWIQQLNRILRKNRTVLKDLNPAGNSTVRQEVLEQMGFNFKFFTHQYKTQKGTTYYFCYEWGYQVLDNGKVLIVIWQNYMKPFNPRKIPF